MRASWANLYISAVHWTKRPLLLLRPSDLAVPERNASALSTPVVVSPPLRSFTTCAISTILFQHEMSLTISDFASAVYRGMPVGCAAAAHCLFCVAQPLPGPIGQSSLLRATMQCFNCPFDSLVLMHSPQTHLHSVVQPSRNFVPALVSIISSTAQRASAVSASQGLVLRAYSGDQSMLCCRGFLPRALPANLSLSCNAACMHAYL